MVDYGATRAVRFQQSLISRADGYDAHTGDFGRYDYAAVALGSTDKSRDSFSAIQSFFY